MPADSFAATDAFLESPGAALDAVAALMRELAQGEPEGDLAGIIAREHLASGGKRLRARLALAAVRALGVPAESGVAWAAACELLHNATLVHDDLQDGDTHRRGQPTVWVRHGPAQAINVGDLLFALPYLAIARVPAGDAVRFELARHLAACTAAVVRGQTAELALAARDAITFAEYEAAVVGKTSALFELPVRGAAVLAGRDETEAARLALPFRRLGVLFQMQDDVLDLYGDKGRGGLVGSDLYEGKVSCLVVEHLVRHAGERQAVLALLRAPREATPAAEVDRLIARFRDSGALAAVLARIRGLASAIADDASLSAAGALRPLARELVELVLRPIAHLMG